MKGPPWKVLVQTLRVPIHIAGGMWLRLGTARLWRISAFQDQQRQLSSSTKAFLRKEKPLSLIILQRPTALSVAWGLKEQEAA